MSLVVHFATLLKLKYDMECSDDEYVHREATLRVALTDTLEAAELTFQGRANSERQTKNEFMDYEYEYSTREELALALVKEARVCGDDIRWPDGNVSAEIFNFHQMSVRWKGTVIKHGT
ncbi:hypothetical protein LCGC14_0753010 [marine sediment metagenome]|uniref:Uncharacterized protein n=1 Tax=marine sediment metagenome TaxID=412755 RepID=A0A0F9QNA2_9ZZZZ